MSMFRKAVENKAEEVFNLNPSVQTGYLIQNSQVFEVESKNIYFYSLNSMSLLDYQKLERDPIFEGYSVGVKDFSGSSRKENIFISPKFSNEDYIGSVSGKRPIPSTNSTSIILTDIIYSGGNNQNPTIVSCQALNTQVHYGTQSTAKDISNNLTGSINKDGKLEDTEGFKPINPLGTESKINLDFKNKNILDIAKDIVVSMLHKNGKESKRKDTTDRGPYKNNIRTGTTKISLTEISNLAKGFLGLGNF